MKQRRHRSRIGFTFLEIMVVVIILAVLAALVMPKMGFFYKRSQLQTSAREIVSILRYGRHAAIMMEQAVELRIDLENGQYQLKPVYIDRDGNAVEEIDLSDLMDGDGGGFVPRGESMQIKQLPTEVFFTIVQSAAPVSELHEFASIMFLPDGSATSANISIQNTEGQALNIQLFRTTGAVKLEEGEPVEMEGQRQTFFGPSEMDYRGYR